MLVIRTLLILLLLGWTSLSSGQSFSFSGFQNVQVRVNDEPLANPFSGSYNSGQFWPCDLDNDGTDDLLVYDKSGRKVLTFMSRMVGGNPSWVYNPDYEDLVPPIESWLSTADFNCDGKLDIFTQTSAGIKVYRNASSGIGQAAFVLEVDGLMSQGFNGPINIQVNPYGAPAFSDVDSDGDLDILCFDFSGNTVEYH
ncbi:MAG TPA: VCBS repeat-containing protein, partial [Catalimonadaceae bacterium]|nr:VCBS repeat-containing protein [Catalimonadaceae bacterium]